MVEIKLLAVLRSLVACMLLTLVGIQSIHAAIISDDFTLDSNAHDWVAQYYACLTARNGSSNGTSTIPGCNYSSPDVSGSGALRLTPASGNQHGAIVSNYTFPSSQGLQVTFTTYAFGGDRGGSGGLGADGISFFLMDGSVGTSLGSGNSAIPNLGAWGGSLAYSCSNGNSPYNGLTGAYLGLGMDEYGNFLNSGDNTSTGIAAQSATTSSNGYNNWGNGTYQSNRIGLRGAGNVSWFWLNQNYPLLYPSSLDGSTQNAAVQKTCSSGFLWDFGNAVSQTITSATVSGSTMTVTLPSTLGYVNGDTVTIGGDISASNASQNISNASVSGSSLTFTASGGSYSSGQNVTIGGTINVTLTSPPMRSISKVSNYVASPKSFRLYTDVSGLSAGGSVYINGMSGGTGYPNGAYSISSVNTSNGYLVLSCISCTSTYPTWGSAFAFAGSTAPTYTPTAISGNYTTASGTSGTTVVIALSSTASAVSNTSGTVTANPPSVQGSYNISNLTSTTFQVSLGSSATTITNNTGSVTNTSIPNNGRQTTVAVQNYAAIPLGYWVLPSTQPISNESTNSRSSATPITYKLTITTSGNLNFLYSYNGGAYQQVLTNWPITANNGPLPSSFRFGFAAATGGSTNNHDITCFQAQPEQSASGAGANTVQAGQVKTTTQVYTASYDSNYWSGSVTAQPIVQLSDGTYSIGTATWDANCALTGGACSTTGVALSTGDWVASTDRTMLTWSGSAGTALRWNSLTGAQQGILNSTDSSGSSRLDWLRGVRTNEQTATPAGTLRGRTGVLGDVVDSSPTWVGAPNLNYGSALVDSLYATTGSETSHAVFNTGLKSRLNIVYAGSNDGFLHGFRAGRDNSDGSYDSSVNDGKEVVAFMPSTALANSNVVGLTSPTYGHSYFVDAAPGYGDVYYNGAWHTWLVGGLGAGGKEIFALDVTDPEGTVSGTTAFSEASASSIVVGDWTASTLTSCVNATTGCGNNLGNTYGTPIVRRLHNGKWAIIFGNGYGSSNQTAGVFIGQIDPSNGSVAYTWLGTGSGSSSTPNGIGFVSSADLDGDHITDYLYAGDLLGQVWRFDLTSSNPADWAVSTYGQPGPTPLFSAGSTHPITTQVATTVIALPNLGQRVMLGVGTGQAVPFTSSSAVTYASGTQSVYGLWDWDMTAWNNGRTTASSVAIPASTTKFAALAQITASPYRTFSKTDLLSNVLATSTATTRTASISTVCWQGSTVCSTGNNKYGWVFDFPTSKEQLVYNPVFQGGTLFLNTTIPPGTAVAGTCIPPLPTGWTMAFNMASGGGFTQNAFPDSNNSFVVATGSSSITGVMQSGVGKPYIVSVGSQQYVVNQTAGGEPTIKQINPQGGVTVKRLSWEQIR